MRRVQFSVGLTDQEGNAIASDRLHWLTQDATDLIGLAFGGCSMHKAVGSWLTPDDGVLIEDCLIFTSDISDTLMECAPRNVGRRLAKLFKQDCVHVAVWHVTSETVEA